MKPLNNKQTNIAWQKLYDRLNEDGFISDDMTQNRRQYTINSSAYKWIASVAVLLIIALSTPFFLSKDNSVNKPMKKLYCSELSSTLITTLEDGSVIGLNNQSTLSYPEIFSDSKREVFLKGNAYFDIAKDSKPFIIETERITVEVLGTAFSIENNKDHFSVSVQRGKVKVSPKNGQSPLYIEANETALFEGNKLTKTKSSNPDIFANYFKSIHFKDEHLINIIRAINLNSDSTTLQLDPELYERTLTVSFLSYNPKQMAELIALALNLNVEQDSDKITIREKMK